MKPYIRRSDEHPVNRNQQRVILTVQPLFKYPMKPIRASWDIFDKIDLSRYWMEAKLDGWRAIIQTDESNVALWTREKRPIEIPNNLRDQLLALRLPPGTLLDGEIWNMDKRGAWRHNKSCVCALTLWDAIRVGWEDLSDKPLSERRQRLDALLSLRGTPDIKATVMMKPSTETGRQIEQEALSFRSDSKARSGFIHGVVLKRLASPRRDHVIRSTEHADWIKIVFNLS